MVSQRAIPNASATLENQPEPTVFLSRSLATACQSLAHQTTLMGRCFKSADSWAPLCECEGLRGYSRVAALPHKQPKGSKNKIEKPSLTLTYQQ